MIYSNLNFDIISDSKIDVVDKSSKNQLNESPKEELSDPMQESIVEEKVVKSSNDYSKATEGHLVAKKNFVYLEQLRKRTQGITDVLFEDSSIFVRKSMSIALLLFAFLFILSTLGSELGERCLDYLFRKIEVTNYFDSARHT